MAIETRQRISIEERLKTVTEVAAEHAAQVDKKAEFPEAAVAALRKSGLLGLTLPEAVGGLGAGPVEFSEVVAAISAACGSTGMIYLMHVSTSMLVAAAPPPGMPDVLRRLADGTNLATLAFSERGSRSHFWAPVSEEVAWQNGVRIKAQKSWVTSAGHADVIAISTLSATGKGPTDSNLYLIPGKTEGLTIAGPWEGMGLRGNASSPMTLDLNVETGRRLGKDGEGFRLMMEVVLPWFNLGNAGVSIGLADGALQAAVRHCSGSRFEHTGESLAQLPTIRARLARMRISLDGQKAYLRQAAESIAAAGDTTMLQVLGVKASANDAALTITEDAMRVCGGAAFSQHLAIDRFFRDARAGSVMAPTADVLYDFYGKAITGQPLF